MSYPTGRAINHSIRCSRPELVDPWGDEYRKNPHALGARVCPECWAKEFPVELKDIDN